MKDVLIRSEAEEVDKKKQQVESEIAAAMAAVFNVTAKQIRQAFEQGNFVLPGEAEVSGDAVLLEARQLLDRESLRERLQQRFDEEVPPAIREGFETGLQRMNAEGAFNPQDPLVQTTVRRLQQQAVGITDATGRRINEVIRREMDDPDQSAEDIAETVVDEVEGMAALPQDEDEMSRAQRIAATTTQTAFESGQMSALRELGATGKTWVSMRDRRVRSGHLQADAEGQTVRLDQPFRVSPVAGVPREGRQQLSYPGDPSGSPANVINCRCTVRPALGEQQFQEAQETEPDLDALPQISQEND